MIRHKEGHNRSGVGTVFQVQSTRYTDHNDKALDWVFAECSLLIKHITIVVYFIYPLFTRDRQPRYSQLIPKQNLHYHSVGLAFVFRHRLVSTMTTFAPRSGPGDMATFNILHGFAEALVRGMRNSFLADSDYHHLTQCESLEDVKLNLTESDYSDALADMGSISPNELQKQAIEKV